MFELHIADVNVTSSTLPVSWCVDVELLKNLADRGIKDPQVVIVTAPVGSKYYEHKENRKVVPLKDLLAYVEFRSAGPNKVWAFVANIAEAASRTAKEKYLSKKDGEYNTTLLNSSGDEWSHYSGTPLFPATTLDVDVPAECFAPEPSAWEKTWVNHFFRNKPTDQCDFRRRRLFAYLVQPVVMLVNILMRFLPLAVSLLFGLRAMSLTKVLHPLRYDLGSSFGVADFSKGSYFIRRLKEDGDPDAPVNLSYLLRKLWPLPFMPVVLIAIGLLWYHHVFLSSFSIVAIVLILLSLIIFFVEGGPKAVYRFLTEWVDNLCEPQEAWYLNQGEMDLIVCSGEKKIRTFADLPSQKKTIRLRFLDLKSKVCRPFSS